MKNECNLIIFFIALIIFSFWILPMISSSPEKQISFGKNGALNIDLFKKNIINFENNTKIENILSSNSTNIEDVKVTLNNGNKSSELDFKNKKASKISIENTSPAQGGQKIGNTQITDLFLSPDKKFSLFDQKNQPEINPSLDDTYLLKIKDEIEKKKSIAPEIPKKIPKVIKQSKIDKNEILNLIEEDSKLNDTKDYAFKKGFTTFNDSILIDYSDGAEAVVLVLKTDEGSTSYLVKYSLGDKSQSFLLDFNYKGEVNRTYATFSGSDWNATLDLTNGSIVAGVQAS